MARDPEPARRSLIAAGERLFAARGIRAVSLREINKAAGQRNSSALHYHFGSRDGLLRAIVAEHAGYVRARRLELIDELGADRGTVDVRSAARILVEPITAPLEHGRRGRAYAQILPQVLTDAARPPSELGDFLGETAREQAYDLLAPHCASLPDRLVRERLAVLTIQTVHSVADRARIEDRSHTKWPLAPLPLFVSNLVDMFVAGLVGPPSPETMAALREAEHSVKSGKAAKSRKSRGTR
jgi:AcrR family transcriptional regulator